MKEIYSAFVKAQSQFPTIEKASAVNAGKFNFNYASYSDICSAIKKPLSDNNLAFIHTREPSQQGDRLVTTLIHESGESLCTSQPVPDITDSQQYGAWLTYMRRYQLSALLGLATDEDVEAPVISQIEIDKQPEWSWETQLYIRNAADTLGKSVSEVLSDITNKDVKKIEQVPVAWEDHVIKTLGKMLEKQA